MGETGLPTWGLPARLEETHTSLLFFVADRVYKLRKPVRFGFLDFRDRAEREADCRREVVLNRRLAPSAYLGVADLVLDGVPVDHMVVMQRFPEERNLAIMAARGDDLGAPLCQIARTLASFHRDAGRSATIDAEATPEVLEGRWQENFDETEAFLGIVLDAGIDAEIRSLATRWIRGRGPLLRARVAEGHVCDGHGDLQATDIFCMDEGVQILDCLEFSDRLRYGDVASDVAFLAMDLERLGRLDAATRFAVEYEKTTGTTIPGSLLHHYQAARAYVRAKVACLRLAQGVDAARSEAVATHALALDHLRRGRVRMVLVGGLPGSGKSTLSRGIAPALDATVLRSDEIRRDLLGSPETPGGTDRYAPEATGSVYGEMLRRSRSLLETGVSVVLDASWVDQGRRAQAREVAALTSSELIELVCQVDPDTALARISRRLAEGLDASEATASVREQMRRSMCVWETATIIDTSDPDPNEAIERARSVVCGTSTPSPSGP